MNLLRKRNSNLNSIKAFTLLEVVVAMMIFSISILAIVDTIKLQNKMLFSIENTMLANWVANNVIAVQFNKKNLAEQVVSGKTDTLMYGKLFYWKIEQVTLTDQIVLKTLSVSLDENFNNIVSSKTFYGSEGGNIEK